jgi:hypothetical protein
MSGSGAGIAPSQYAPAYSVSADNTLHIGRRQPWPTNSIFYGDAGEVLRIGSDGRIFWRGREIDTDDDLRAAMREVNDLLRGLFGLPSHARHHPV